MKVTINKDSTCGKIEVPSGEYLVSLASETGQLALAGGGKTYKVPAVRRRANGKGRTATVSLVPGGGATYSLVMSTPKLGEWVAIFEIVGSRAKDGSR